MGTPVWGTFSVRDHCRPEAFLREVLLFDRLAVPYPDPNVPAERDRWRRPNQSDASETWDPERLDQLLSVLGTDENPGYDGARLAQRVLWNPYVWEVLQSRLGAANAITGDPFLDTRLGIVLRRGEELPGAIEAVAAYPSEAVWRKDAQLSRNQPEDVTAAEALVQLARPLLLPGPGGDELDTLRRAVDLARSDDYVSMRASYFDWFRDFIEPLRSDGVGLREVRVDPASLELAKAQLRELWLKEKAIVKRADKARFWTRVEVGCVSIGTAGTVGLACLAALPVVGAGAGLLAFMGWGINRWQAPKPARSLGGASMFVEPQTRLNWLQPTFTFA